jgi:hypothetical protein
MATTNTSLCPLLIEAEFTATQIKNQVTLKRTSLEWWGSQLTLAERKGMTIKIWNIITSEGANNCGSAYDMARRIGAPEPLVRQIIDQIYAVSTDLITQLKAEGQ